MARDGLDLVNKKVVALWAHITYLSLNWCWFQFFCKCWAHDTVFSSFEFYGSLLFKQIFRWHHLLYIECLVINWMDDQTRIKKAFFPNFLLVDRQCYFNSTFVWIDTCSIWFYAYRKDRMCKSYHWQLKCCVWQTHFK